MKTTLSLVLSAVLLMTACQPQPSAGKLLEEMEALIEDVADRDIGAPIDTARVQSLVEEARQLAQSQPQDSLAPAALYQAAELARSIGRYPEAVEMLAVITDRHPDYEKAAEALFLRAFIYDEDLGDKAQALESYRTFVNNYSEHPLARDAQAMITYLEMGKTPEELIREFEGQKEENVQ